MNDDRRFEQLDKALAPFADEMADEIGRLTEQLAELDLIDKDNPGKVHMNTLAGAEFN
jgi:hypothetical protein